MNSFTIQSPISLRFPLSPLQTHQKYTIKITKRIHFLKHASPCVTHFNSRQNPISKVVRSSMVNYKLLDSKDAAMLVNTCITHNLPPALNLEQGLDKIKDSVEVFKNKPPSCSSGMFRFQIAVPPSAKALNWYCSQLESSKVFPLFFLSNEKENPTYKSLSIGRTRGVFGIGSAISFKGSSPHASEESNASHASEESNALHRNLAESTSSNAYGFLDIELDTDTSNIKNEIGAYHLFIPHIALDEFEEISFLIATIAWDESSMCTFSKAVQLFELSFDQATRHCVNDSHLIHSSLSKSKSTEDNKQMVRLSALLLDGSHLKGQNYGTGSSSILRDASSNYSQFSTRLSPSLSISNNMHPRDGINRINYFTEECPNINILWASLIVEECVRLGLTVRSSIRISKVIPRPNHDLCFWESLSIRTICKA